MSFREPIVLLGLVLLPVAVLAYLSLQRRRRLEAAAFANPALLPNVVTGAPGWRRHLPPLLVLLAAAVLIVALARPQRTVAAPLRAATVMMVTDTSGSMRANDVEPDRMTAAVRAALKLTDELPEEYRLGLVSFADYAEQQAPPTTDRVPVEAALRGLVANGGTAMVEGIQRGIQAARVPVADESGAGRRRLPAAIVLLSDGAETEGGDPAQVAAEARRANIPVYTVALGTPDGEVEQTDPYGFTRRVPVPPEIDTLQMIAQTTRGRFFAAEDADRLESIYANLGTRLSSKPEQEEITAVVAGGALLLLVAGGALGLAWFGRLPG